MTTLAQLNSYASTAIGGTPVTISCENPFPPAWDGFVNFDAAGVAAPIIHLPVAVCSRLEDPAPNGVTSSDYLTVIHEDEHIHLESENECDVERAGLANLWQFVRQFKYPAWRARAILTGAVLADSILPAQYHTGCSA